MRLLIFAILAVTSSSSSIFAAPPSSGGRTCRILFLAPSANAPEKILLSDGSTIQPVDLPSMTLSRVYNVATGPVTLQLLAQQPTEGQPVPPESPKASVAETIKDFYLLIASDPSNKSVPLKMQVIDADPGSFRLGQSLWYNLTPFPLAGKLGANPFSMKPNSRAITLAPIPSYGDYPAVIGYTPVPGKPAAPLCSTVWRQDPTIRKVMFVVMSPKSRIPEIKGFIDFREKAE